MLIHLDRTTRLFIDMVLLTGMLLLAGLPAVGTRQTHFAIASGTIRVVAVVYAMIVALDGHRIVSERMRRLLDMSMGVMLLAMSWFETFPAGNHVAETGIYAGVGAILLALAAIGGGQRLAVS